MLFFFGIAAIVNTITQSYIVPNTLILGVLLLLFGRQMYQEAVLDKMEAKGKDILADPEE
jgi:uncharacterized membrane protein